MSSTTTSQNNLYATIFGAVAAAASAGIAYYAYLPKDIVEAKKADETDAETVDSDGDLSGSVPTPEVTVAENDDEAEDNTEKEADKEAEKEAKKAAAHKRLREKCMIKKSQQ